MLPPCGAHRLWRMRAAVKAQLVAHAVSIAWDCLGDASNIDFAELSLRARDHACTRSSLWRGGQAREPGPVWLRPLKERARWGVRTGV